MGCSTYEGYERDQFENLLRSITQENNNNQERNRTNNTPVHHNANLTANRNSIPMSLNNDFIRQIESILPSNTDPNFNFPEVKDNIYVGIGLKKMKGYISNITKEELIKKRTAFWGTRTEGNQQTWSFLKELCEMSEEEEADLEAMLQAYDLVAYKNCINITYDASGCLYEIPNYCINDPYKYDLPETHIQKPTEKKISFHLKRENKKTKIKCSNYSLVEKVKEKMSIKINAPKEKIRLFYCGKEMKNDKELWIYNIEEDCVVIVMVNQN